MTRILIIDDEKAIRSALTNILEDEGYEVSTAENGEVGLAMLLKESFDLALCDIKMPKLDGMQLLEALQKEGKKVPVIMISGHGNEEVAYQATQLGAFDFINKPPDLNRLLLTVRNGLEKGQLEKVTADLKAQTKPSAIIGESAGIKAIEETISRVAPTDARVLITGGNGAGKELIARALHQESHRAKGPLVEVNCAAIPGELIESEMFGHEKGAFTSAIKQRIGKFEEANGGTLFLDEIGDMPLAAQAKVLRALQENRITRVGGTKDLSVDVRVIAATNKDLSQEIEKGNFRIDLYHRINVIHIHVPSLNERRDDIPLLVHFFLGVVCKDYGMPAKPISNDAVALLQTLNWSGNIRELRNVIERLVILSGVEISAKDVKAFTQPLAQTGDMHRLIDSFQSLHDFSAHSEKLFLQRKLELSGNNLSKAAEEIGIPRTQLAQKLEFHGLQS